MSPFPMGRRVRIGAQAPRTALQGGNGTCRRLCPAVLAAVAQFQISERIDHLQTTRFERGIVSCRVALLLRSAEIQPLFDDLSTHFCVGRPSGLSGGRTCIGTEKSAKKYKSSSARLTFASKNG